MGDCDTHKGLNIKFKKCWTEDFHLENGNQMNICVVCNEQFLGHKRRFICRWCAKRESQKPEE